ncbi:hypothetical protein MMC31_007509 [Peltigera leucophlebia]|nr:hypothetical protein [Peltigera leucophlebia]
MSARVAIDPAKTALVIIDLQNYFLSPSLGRPSDAIGLKVVDKLLEHVIPACRKAGIPIVWLGWGLTKQDIDEMPPTIVKGFEADNNFGGERLVKGLGTNIGSVREDDGTLVEGGRVLMRDQWNSAMYAPLKEKYGPQDIKIDKNRLSGFWGGTKSEQLLSARGIRTLIFAGANTDQCVGGSPQDAFTKGWDCLLLSDGCATTSPDFARQCINFDTNEGWGFVLSYEGLAKGIDCMQREPSP